MVFETFRGRDVGEALEAIRAAFGSDAWIGETRRLSNGRAGALGHEVVEVQAAPAANAGALEDRSRRTSVDAAPQRPRPSLPRVAARANPPTPQASTERRWEATPDATADAVLATQLATIRSLLEEIHAARPSRDRVLSMLHGARIEGSLAAAIAKGASNLKHKDEAALRQWLRERIAQRVAVLPSPIEQDGQRIIMCVGPTGVGKTTTIAKLAARAHLEFGRSLSILSLDTYRVGSIDQIRRFAELIGVRFHVGQDPNAIRQVIASNRSDILLVDTASLPPQDAASRARVQACCEAEPQTPMDVLLVMPAMTPGTDAERLTRAYGLPKPTGLVVTKLDETERAGGVAHASIVGGVPVAYLSRGPRVPEDIESATVDSFLETLLPVGR